MRPTRVTPVILLMGAIAFGNAGGNLAENLRSAPNGPALQSYASQVFNSVSRSVFVVEATNWKDKLAAIGSGVSVAENLVVTNCHVVAESKEIRVRQTGGTWPAHVTDENPERDLCLLRVEGLNAQAVSIRTSSTLTVGERAYAVGAQVLTCSRSRFSGSNSPRAQTRQWMHFQCELVRFRFRVSLSSAQRMLGPSGSSSCASLYWASASSSFPSFS